MANIAQNPMITTHIGSIEYHRDLWNYISGVLKRGFDTLLTWQRREQQRRHLRELSHDLLKDMGLSEADFVRGMQKPFWKE